MANPKHIRNFVEKTRIKRDILDNKKKVIKTANIEYEDSELGRMWDIYLGHILNRISPNFYVIPTIADLFVIFVDIYNNDVPDNINPIPLSEAFTRIMEVKNRPTKIENSHFGNFIGIRYTSDRHREFTSRAYESHLENTNPFIYRAERFNDDVYRFCNGIIERFGSIEYFFMPSLSVVSNVEYQFKKRMAGDEITKGKGKPTYMDGTPMPLEVAKERVFDEKDTGGKG